MQDKGHFYTAIKDILIFVVMLSCCKKVAEPGKGMVNQFPLSGGFCWKINSLFFFFGGGGGGCDVTVVRQYKQSENGMTLQWTQHYNGASSNSYIYIYIYIPWH